MPASPETRRWPGSGAERIRVGLPWLPLPTLALPVWLAAMGLILALLFLLTPGIRCGQAWSRGAAYAFGGVMIANGLLHLGGSVLLSRWLPGANSGPLLIAAGAWLVAATWRRFLPPAAGRPGEPRKNPEETA